MTEDEKKSELVALSKAFDEDDLLPPSYELGRNQLYAALATAQGATMAALKETEGQVGQVKRKYADLASCWDACRENLAANGLCVVQIPCAEGTRVSVTTILGHKSGQEISGTLTMVSQLATPQGIGSAITYARRYALCAMVGISPEDDDGEAASNPDKKSDRANGVIAAKVLAEAKVEALKNGAKRQAVEAMNIESEGLAEQLESSIKTAKCSKLFEMLKLFKELKAELGESQYYAILGRNGYEKSNQITDVEIGRRVYKEMRLAIKEKESA